jgi:hypothetical protein
MTTLAIISIPLAAGIIFLIYMFVSEAKEKKAKSA